MLLTNLDGVLFELDVAMIKEMHDRRNYREIRTIMKDVLQVKETIPEIMDKVREDKRK